MDSRGIIITLFPTSPYHLICPLISLISAVAVIILSILTGHYKEPLRKMVIIILMLDSIYCLPILIAGYPYPKSDAFCKFFTVVSHFGLEGSCAYSALFAHALFTVIKELDSTATKQKLWWYFFWGIVVPFLNCLSLVFTSYVQYDPDHKLCVRRATLDTLDTYYFLWTSLPVTVCCMLSLIWYALTARQLRTIVTETRNRDLMVLLLYPAIMISCRGPNIILNATMNFGNSATSLWINLFAEGANRLQGFLNAIVYGCSGKMVLEIRNLKCCRCLCKNKNDELHYSNIDTSFQVPHEGRQNANSRYSIQRTQPSKQIDRAIDGEISSLLLLKSTI